MTTQQVADRLVKLCREGKFELCIEELYSTDIKSIEPEGSVFETELVGLDNLLKKGEQWESMVETVHSSEISDPLVAENFFSITMKLKATLKGMNEPINMDEVCIYQVENGKVVTEQFFYTPMTEPV